MNKPLTCVHKDAWLDGTRPSCGKTISLSNDTVKKIRRRTVEPQKNPKNKTTPRQSRVVLFFPTQSLHPRQGWECSNCSEVSIWLCYFLYPWVALHHHPPQSLIGQPACARHHGRSVAILCKLTPVNHLTHRKTYRQANRQLTETGRLQDRRTDYSSAENIFFFMKYFMNFFSHLIFSSCAEFTLLLHFNSITYYSDYVLGPQIPLQPS